MAKATKVNQLIVETPDEVGMMAKLCSAISDAGVNIKALCAYSQEGKGHFMLLTNDNAKAEQVLKSGGFTASQEEVVAIELENEVGAAKKMTQKLADAGVNLKYCYGSTGNGTMALLIFNSNDNEKALEALGT
ncbi:MAG: ACT domain-containing protein [Firmicutes bacterium]|nr:ACT domain-containing protein [Bacillota bacterium]